MHERLHQIAESQGGFVPLHGRLFAEWLHYAFPRECPYPHKAGAYRLSLMTQWEAVSGMDSILDAKECEAHGEDLSGILPEHRALHEDFDWEHAAMDTIKEQSIQWADEEDTIVPWSREEEHALGTGAIIMSILRVLMMVSAVLGMGGLIVQQCSVIHSELCVSASHKQYVV